MHPTLILTAHFLRIHRRKHAANRVIGFGTSLTESELSHVSRTSSFQDTTTSEEPAMEFMSSAQ